MPHRGALIYILKDLKLPVILYLYYTLILYTISRIAGLKISLDNIPKIAYLQQRTGVCYRGLYIEV